MPLIKRNKFIKYLVSSAIAGLVTAPAMAQTSVKVEGVIDQFVGSMRNPGDTASTLRQGGSGMTTSYFGFSGSEDLGGGLKANFALTGFFQPPTGGQGRFTGDTFFSRDSSVGLSGQFGSVTLGRSLAPHLLPAILFNPFGDSFTFSPLNVHLDLPLFNASGWTNSVGGDTGWSNQILYTTPDFSGLTANLHYQLGGVAGNTGKNNVGANVLYFKGPLSLTAFYHVLKVNNPLDVPVGIVKSVAGLNASQQKAWMVGGAYDFTAVKLFATYGQTSHDVDFSDKTISLGASVPVGGSGKVMLAWADTKRSGASFATVKRDTISVGYDHNLSKRTDLYAVFMNDKISNFDSGNSFAAGIRHRF
jgi:predicted porin